MIAPDHAAPADPYAALIAKLRKGHWEGCALYTTDPAEGHSCDCDYPLHMEAAAAIAELVRERDEAKELIRDLLATNVQLDD